MDVRECYSRIKGNYEEILGRMRNEERVKKFLRLFLKDGSYERLCAAMEAGDCSEAFLAAHSLKGVSQNLAFTDLFASVEDLTERLRAGQCGAQEREIFNAIKEKYDVLVKTIEKLE